MEEWAEWCAANQPISPFPVKSLLGHPVLICLLHYSSKSLPWSLMPSPMYIPLQTLSGAYRNTKQPGNEQTKAQMWAWQKRFDEFGSVENWIGRDRNDASLNDNVVSSVSHLRHVIIRSFFCVLHSGALSLSPSSSPMGIVLYAPIRRGRSLLPLLEAYLLRWDHCPSLLESMC